MIHRIIGLFLLCLQKFLIYLEISPACIKVWNTHQNQYSQTLFTQLHYRLNVPLGNMKRLFDVNKKMYPLGSLRYPTFDMTKLLQNIYFTKTQINTYSLFYQMSPLHRVFQIQKIWLPNTSQLQATHLLENHISKIVDFLSLSMFYFRICYFL